MMDGLVQFKFEYSHSIPSIAVSPSILHISRVSIYWSINLIILLANILLVLNECKSEEAKVGNV